MTVMSSVDSSLVNVSGPGLEHGLIDSHQSHFTVNTTGAGPGQLTVRIRGPKGRVLIRLDQEGLGSGGGS